MHFPQVQREQNTLTAPQQKVRFKPVLNLDSGVTEATFAESQKKFSEFVSFGPAGAMHAGQIHPAKWLANQIESIASHIHQPSDRKRPIIVSAPIAAFSHSGTAAHCEAATARTKLCPQEISLEFSDGALAASLQDTEARVRNLRRRGFRVSIDARKAWYTPLSEQLKLAIDTYRVDAVRLNEDDDLKEQCTKASMAGITVIAERARWRDADWLSEYGIERAIKPRADA